MTKGSSWDGTVKGGQNILIRSVRRLPEGEPVQGDRVFIITVSSGTPRECQLLILRCLPASV
jgi:hypothetical protein